MRGDLCSLKRPVREAVSPSRRPLQWRNGWLEKVERGKRGEEKYFRNDVDPIVAPACESYRVCVCTNWKQATAILGDDNNDI